MNVSALIGATDLTPRLVEYAKSVRTGMAETVSGADTHGHKIG